MLFNNRVIDTVLFLISRYQFKDIGGKIACIKIKLRLLGKGMNSVFPKPCPIARYFDDVRLICLIETIKWVNG